jgi:carbamoyltransferase
VPSAPADDGNAIGAALLAWQEDHDAAPAPPRGNPYLGSRARLDALGRAQQLGGLRNVAMPDVPVHQSVAEMLAAGRVVGWFQGRAEFGPRALGNRSILADPRDPDVKERLNATVKFREEFRPFAPSILDEHGPQWFERYQGSRYMDRTLRFRKEQAPKVPGVVHADGTGRVQTVKREWNERFYDLIAAFHERTGVPLLLNTSFNVMGKPIVHSVEDALAVFFTSGLDVLVIEDTIFVKT